MGTKTLDRSAWREKSEEKSETARVVSPAVPGIEVFRGKMIWVNGAVSVAEGFPVAVRTVQLLGHTPVVQSEGSEIVLYAVASAKEAR